MAYQVENSHFESIVVLRTQRYTDHRGYFQELIQTDQLASLGIPTTFAQVNHSRSIRGVIRGLHAQLKPAQGKLLHVLRGAIQLIELDIRHDSPTFGQHVSITVSDENGRLVWIPPGFANGFCANSEFADVVYYCTESYNPDGEIAIHALDKALEIDWCEGHTVLSQKDRAAPTLSEVSDLLRAIR
ncbi:MAG: dTDP-4-dehydrorhamnose 3,5-epimerase [bacterium]|nr:dTDP-4-dehydrorhamnose 3,5-epimerase [bacterium]